MLRSIYTRAIGSTSRDPGATHAPGRGSRALRAAVLALALSLAAAVPAAAQSPVPGGPTTAPKADTDRDRVFDDLEQRLGARRPGDGVDVIVTLDDPASAARVSGLERRVGDLAVRERFGVVDGFAARVTKAQVAELARRPGVASVEADAPVRTLNESGSNAFGVTRARIDNPKLDGERDGKPGKYSPGDMVAAVVDTGIDVRHRDLDEGKILGFADCSGDSARCLTRSAYDDDGHGTHVAGTLAGDGDARPEGRRHRGVAPAAALVGVKVFKASGTGSERNVIAGVDWAVANRKRYGIEAINLSLGGFKCSNGTDAMSKAANRAAAAGLVVVAAAGNSGPARCTVTAPAAASGVLAVGRMADTAHGGFFASHKSGRGQLGQPVKPDVMAPGEDVVSARAGSSTGYTTLSGSSMASPFVAGVALLMRDANPGIKANTVRAQIKKSAVDWGPGGPDIDFGWGRLDAYAALQAAGAGRLATPPAVPDHRAFEDSFTALGDRRVDEPHEIREYPIEIKNRCTPIAASVVTVPWNGYTDEAGDFGFDVRLFDPSGNEVEVGEGISDERQDDLSHRPARLGTYRLEVVNYEGKGDFFADLSAGLSPPPDGAPTGCGTP